MVFSASLSIKYTLRSQPYVLKPQHYPTGSEINSTQITQVIAVSFSYYVEFTYRDACLLFVALLKIRVDTLHDLVDQIQSFTLLQVLLFATSTMIQYYFFKTGKATSWQEHYQSAGIYRGQLSPVLRNSLKGSLQKGKIVRADTTKSKDMIFLSINTISLYKLICLLHIIQIYDEIYGPMYICTLFLNSISYLNSSMKKGEGETIRKLKFEDYEIGRVLGKGGFGKVKVAKNKKTGKYVALKLLNKHEIKKAQQVDHVYNENFVHSQLSHPFIVNFEGLIQDSKYLYLVLELINGGQLFTYLRNVESFSTDQARFYGATVASCFEYLHSKNIVFRDLKPQNLLIANDGYLKLADFGFAKFLTEGRTFTICGTPEYIAPEVILNQGHGKAVDWWTLGVLIYEMHAGIDPFNDDDPMCIYKNILRGKISFPTNFDKEAKSLVKHLLVADLSKRYGNLKDGANDIKKHRWFNNFSWDDLLKKKIKANYVPSVKSLGDVSNFEEYPDSGNGSAIQLKPNDDPFLNW